MLRFITAGIYACTMTVEAVFDQTPGRSAGTQLRRTVMTPDGPRPIALSEIAACFEGLIPAEIATASADGVPTSPTCRACTWSTTSGSRSPTSSSRRRRATWPRTRTRAWWSSIPLTYDSYRMMLVYERTERRGPIFERLRRDVDAIAALTGMAGIFKLRSADIYRVVEVEQVLAAVHVAEQ